jgi:hypothetical protein
MTNFIFIFISVAWLIDPVGCSGVDSRKLGATELLYGFGGRSRDRSRDGYANRP